MKSKYSGIKLYKNIEMEPSVPKINSIEIAESKIITFIPFEG